VTALGGVAILGIAAAPASKKRTAIDALTFISFSFKHLRSTALLNVSTLKENLLLLVTLFSFRQCPRGLNSMRKRKRGEE
jgi:hypothetical protein